MLAVQLTAVRAVQSFAIDDTAFGQYQEGVSEFTISVKLCLVGGCGVWGAFAPAPQPTVKRVDKAADVSRFMA